MVEKLNIFERFGNGDHTGNLIYRSFVAIVSTLTMIVLSLVVYLWIGLNSRVDALGAGGIATIAVTSAQSAQLSAIVSQLTRETTLLTSLDERLSRIEGRQNGVP